MAKAKNAVEKPRQLQLIYDEVLEKKQSEKELKEMYKDALRNADKYSELGQKIEELRNKRKAIELKIQSQLGRSWETLLDIKSELDGKKVMLTDVALRDLMDGKTVEVVDDFGNVYEPVWSVKLKKSGEVRHDKAKK